MASRSRRRKQQTRLTFTPVASSPSAPKSSFAPAYVGYEGANFRSRSPGFKLEEDAKPSFQDGLEDEASSDMMPTPRRTQPSSRISKPQRESSASSDGDDQLLTSGSRKRKRAGPSMWRDQAHDKARQPRISSSLSRRVPSDKEDSEPLPRTSPQLSRLSNRRRQVSSESEENQQNNDGSPVNSKSRQRISHTARRSKSHSPIDHIPPSSSSRITRSARKAAPSQPIVIESSEEDEMSTKMNRNLDALQAMADEDASEDSVPPPRKSTARHGKASNGDPKFSRYSADRDNMISPPPSTRKSRLANRPAKSSTPKAPRTADREDDDLAEDLEFLQRSSPPATSSMGKRKKNARESALEQLKRRRRGEVTILSDEPDDGDAQEVSSDDDADGQDGVAGLDQSDGEDSEPNEAEERRGAIYSEIGGYGGHIRERRSRRSVDLDGEDVDDFIVSDEELEGSVDESHLGAPDNSAQIPIELTRFAKMKAKDLFRYIVEWMVQKRLNPAFQSDDELYTLAFRKVEDELNGLVGSKFRSSIWTPDFLYALNGRPDLSITDLHGEIERDHCEACGRKTHPASYQMQFFGKPYYIETLEDVEQADDHSPDSESDDDPSSEDHTSSPDSKEVVDAKGRVLVSATHKFNVGRNCKHNASTAHALHHWRTHLYEHIKEHLHKVGTDTAEAIIRRDNMSTRKRMDQANRIVDQMVENGIVRRIWRDFRGEIDAARAARQ